MKIFAFIILLFTSAAASAQEDGFLPYFGDVPIMAGLTELVEERVLFDTPAGTIAETVIAGEIPNEDVIDFYTKTLAALGWSPIPRVKHSAGYDYQRENVVLVLRITESNGISRLILRIKPTRS